MPAKKKRPKRPHCSRVTVKSHTRKFPKKPTKSHTRKCPKKPTKTRKPARKRRKTSTNQGTLFGLDLDW